MGDTTQGCLGKAFKRLCPSSDMHISVTHFKHLNSPYHHCLKVGLHCQTALTHAQTTPKMTGNRQIHVIIYMNKHEQFTEVKHGAYNTTQHITVYADLIT